MPKELHFLAEVSHIIKVASFLIDEAAECYQQTFLAEKLIIIRGVFFQDGRSQLNTI